MLQRKPSNVSDKPKLSQRPKRSASFGRFDGLRFSSPTKLDLNRTDLHVGGRSEPRGEQDKASSLGKKMRAISLTMRKRMARSYTKALSEEMVEEAGREQGSQAEGNVPLLRMASWKGNTSLDNLCSMSSHLGSSGGVSDGSGTRQNLRPDVELPYTGPFCGRARVHTNFVPSPYETDSLRLKVGDVIDIISKTPMGIWTGMLHDKVGTFKFIYVDLLEERAREKAQPHQQSQLPMPATLQEFLEKLHLEEHASTLLLNGYQTVEDLRELTEQHLCELNVTEPEHRRLLLAAAHCLPDAEGAGDASERGADARFPRGSDNSGHYAAGAPCQDGVMVQA